MYSWNARYTKRFGCTSDCKPSDGGFCNRKSTSKSLDYRHLPFVEFFALGTGHIVRDYNAKSMPSAFLRRHRFIDRCLSISCIAWKANQPRRRILASPFIPAGLDR